MTMRIEFTPEIIGILNEERYRHPVPLVQRRMLALWLKSKNYPHGQITEIVGVTENTIREYFQLFIDGGIEKLKEINFYRPESELTAHVTSLQAYFQANPPATIKEAQAVIEAQTGIKRSETQVRQFLKKNSISVVGRSG